MKKWPFVVFLGVALAFSVFVFYLAVRPEPIEVLPDTFEAEVNWAKPTEHLLSVRVLGQRYTGHLTINTEKLALPGLCKGFRVQITLDSATPHPSESSRPIQVSNLQVLESPPAITELTELRLEGFIVSKEGLEIVLLVGDKAYRVMPDKNSLLSPGDRIAVSYYPGPRPDCLEFVTEIKKLEDAGDMDWGVQLDVLEMTRYQCKLRIRKDSDFPLPLTVDNNIKIYLPIPAETLPYSISCTPPEAASEDGSYILSGDDVFIIDFEKYFGPLRWSGIYKFEKTVCYGNIKKTYTVNFDFSVPGADLEEGKPGIDK